MASLFADEDVSRIVVDELIRLGHDVQSVLDAGLASQRTPDQSVLNRTIAEGRCLITHNRRHFHRMHEHDSNHAGIVACTRDDANVLELAVRIHEAVEANEPVAGKLVRVIRPSSAGGAP